MARGSLLRKLELRLEALSSLQHGPVDADRSELLRTLAIHIRSIAWSPQDEPIAERLAERALQRSNEYEGPR